MVHEGEETQSITSDEEEDFDTKYIIETFDVDLEEELAWKFKDVREEIEKPLAEEEKESSNKVEDDTELPAKE